MLKACWVALLAAALVGCGADGGPGEEATAKVARYTLEVPMREWQFQIERRTLSGATQTAMVAAGEVTLLVRNEGEQPHVFAISGPGVDARTPSLAPGEEATLTVKLDRGRYEIGCPEGDHRGRGLAGRIRGQ